MIDKYLVVGIVFAACLVLIIYTQLDSGKKEDKSLSFKAKLQKEFQIIPFLNGIKIS